MDAGEAQTPQLVDFYPFFRPIFRLIPTAWSKYKQALQKIVALEDRIVLPLLKKTKENMEKGIDVACKCPLHPPADALSPLSRQSIFVLRNTDSQLIQALSATV